MRVIWSSAAWDEFDHWIAADLEAAKTIAGLISYVRSASPDRQSASKSLKRDLSGWVALEIKGSHRLVYRMREREGVQCLEILSCAGHYTKDRVF